MTRRGLTLIEVLLALVLVAGLAAACAAWVATAADAIASADRQASTANLDEAMSVIRTDLQSVARVPGGRSERVAWRGDRLSIHCRVAGVGPAWVEYRRADDGALVRTLRAVRGGADEPAGSVIVLHAIEAFDAGVASVEPADRFGEVSVTIASRGERSEPVERSATMVYER